METVGDVTITWAKVIGGIRKWHPRYLATLNTEEGGKGGGGEKEGRESHSGGVCKARERKGENEDGRKGK